MPKNIIICSDGTGNSDIKGRGTNVFKLFESTDLNGHRTDPTLTPQVAIYDDGVGTENFRPLKIFTGATGFGLSRNVKQLYKELVRIYDPGDRIFLFGFSRGAFTVRTLTDFVCKCGILDVKKLSSADKLEWAVRKAYKAYRLCYRTELVKLFLGDREEARIIHEFRTQYCLPSDPSIAFVGVWDTVDAVGLPFHLGDFINLVLYRFKFPDYHLSPLVERACHALSVDDERHSFHPLLWKEDENDSKRIEQVWFAGAHSNVGGGYPKQGMSLVALDWMLHKACAAGLRLLEADWTLYRGHANVDDKLYDPRAGLGIFYRWKPRDISTLCKHNNVKPAIHLSVIERIAHGTEDYAPGNLPPEVKVVTTGKDALALNRAQEVERVLSFAHSRSSKGQSLLCQVKREVTLGLTSYYVYALCCLATILAISASDGLRSLADPWLLVKNSGRLIMNIVTFQFGEVLNTLKVLATSPELLALLLCGFLLSYLLASFADRRMRFVFSEFWHLTQQDLRTALKRARELENAKKNVVKPVFSKESLLDRGSKLDGFPTNIDPKNVGSALPEKPNELPRR
jgi:hypothetical protein